MPQNKEGYMAILEAAFKAQMPQQYREDLTRIDKETLYSEGAPQDFVWSVRECGTWLYSLEELQTNARNTMRALENFFRDYPEARAYLFYKGSLQEMTAELRKAETEGRSFSSVLKDLTSL